MSILSKGLSFIPKPKNIDQSDTLRGLCKFRNQVVKICEAKHKAKTPPRPNQSSMPPATPSTTPLSQNTGTQSSQGPAQIIYRPWDTIKKFRHKRDPTGHPTTNDLLTDYTRACALALVQRNYFGQSEIFETM